MDMLLALISLVNKAHYNSMQSFSLVSAIDVAEDIASIQKKCVFWFLFIFAFVGCLRMACQLNLEEWHSDFHNNSQYH